MIVNPKKEKKKTIKIKVQFQIINMDRLLYKYYIFWIMHSSTHLLNSCFIFYFLYFYVCTTYDYHHSLIRPSKKNSTELFLTSLRTKNIRSSETEIPKFWPWRVLLWLQLPERLLVTNILLPSQSMRQGSKAALHFHLKTKCH